MYMHTIPLIKSSNFWRKKKYTSHTIECLMCAFGQVENSENLEIFFRLFLFQLFNFDPILKIENSEEENSEKKFWGFRGFWHFWVFDLPLFRFFNQVSQILSFSSDRLSFFKLCVFYCFHFLLCWNLLFQAIVSCDYPTCKYMFKVTRIKSNVYYICSKFKKLTKMVSVIANRVWRKLRQVNLYNF